MRHSRLLIWRIMLVAVLGAAVMFIGSPTNRGDIGVSSTEPVHGVPETAQIGVGDRLILDTGYLFESSDPEIASVSTGGVIVGRAEGECEITVHVDGESEPKICTLMVLPPPEELELNCPEKSMGVGESLALVPRACLADGETTASTYAFMSSDRSVLTVNGNGVMTARKKGKATITARTYNGISAQVEITVRSAPSWIRVEGGDQFTMGLGEERDLYVSLPAGSAGGYVIASSDEGVARIHGDRLQAVAFGSATITAQSYNGKIDSCEVVVKRAPTGISLVESWLKLGVGDTGGVEAVLSGRDSAGNISWASDNEAIAAVDAQGEITAMGEGICAITARSYNGHEALLMVEVLPAPSRIYAGTSSVVMGIDELWTFAPVTDPGSATTLSFVSTNSAVASVDQTGQVRARSQGSATITARTHNGLSVKLSVTVKKSPGSVAFASDMIEVCVDDSVRSGARLPSGTGGVLRYSIEDVSVARVDSRGRVTGRAPGTTLLTVETYNGKSAVCEVRVYLPAGDIEGPDEITLVAGVWSAMPVNVVDTLSGPYDGKIDVEIADPDILEYSEGNLLALRSGETYLTVTAHALSRRFDVLISPYSQAVKPEVVAHRGGNGHGVENTLEALRGAAEDGADYVEIDVRATRDGEIVLMHDASLIRLAGAGGSVARMTLEELKRVNLGGAQICTLDEALEFIATTDMGVLLEFKASGIEERCVEAVHRAGLQSRVIYISFNLSILEYVRTLDPLVQLGYLWSTPLSDPAAVAQRLNINYMLPRNNLVNEELVARLHAAGVKVGAWTANNSASIARMQRAGVDLIISDYVSRARAIIQ